MTEDERTRHARIATVKFQSGRFIERKPDRELLRHDLARSRTRRSVETRRELTENRFLAQVPAEARAMVAELPLVKSAKQRDVVAAIRLGQPGLECRGDFAFPPHELPFVFLA